MIIKIDSIKLRIEERSNYDRFFKSIHLFLSDVSQHLFCKVIYAARHEWAITADDIIARRTRLAFLNKDAAIAVIPRY